MKSVYNYVVRPEGGRYNNTKKVDDKNLILNTERKAVPGYCFVKPIKSFDKFNIDQEQPLMGIIEYSDGVYSKGDLVGFTPNSEYEFIINGQKLYRVYTKFITIKYEYQGHEEAYNPSWAHSG